MGTLRERVAGAAHVGARTPSRQIVAFVGLIQSSMSPAEDGFAVYRVAFITRPRGG